MFPTRYLYLYTLKNVYKENKIHYVIKKNILNNTAAILYLWLYI